MWGSCLVKKKIKWIKTKNFISDYLVRFSALHLKRCYVRKMFFKLLVLIHDLLWSSSLPAFCTLASKKCCSQKGSGKNPYYNWFVCCWNSQNFWMGKYILYILMCQSRNVLLNFTNFSIYINKKKCEGNFTLKKELGL